MKGLLQYRSSRNLDILHTPHSFPWSAESKFLSVSCIMSALLKEEMCSDRSRFAIRSGFTALRAVDAFTILPILLASGVFHSYFLKQRHFFVSWGARELKNLIQLSASKTSRVWFWNVATKHVCDGNANANANKLAGLSPIHPTRWSFIGSNNLKAPWNYCRLPTTVHTNKHRI